MSGIINLVLIISLVVVGIKYRRASKKQQEITTEKLPIKSPPPSEETVKDAVDKNYQREGDCQFCQATSLLGLTEKDLPDLKRKKRIGVINSLTVNGMPLFDREYICSECEWLLNSTQIKTTSWGEMTGLKTEHIVILKKSAQKLKSNAEVENNLVIRLVEEEKFKDTGNYRRTVIKTGVKKLMEQNPELVWEWDIYLLAGSKTVGTSDGIPLLLALFSAYYQKPIPNTVAATGAITTKGEVMMIGGLHEKIIAAVESGNKTFVLPLANWDDRLNQPLIDSYGCHKALSDKELADFESRWVKKLKFRPVKDWKDLLNLLERDF